MPQGDYTSKHSIEVLVSVQGLCDTHIGGCCCTLDYAVRISAFVNTLTCEDLELPWQPAACKEKSMHLHCKIVVSQMHITRSVANQQFPDHCTLHCVLSIRLKIIPSKGCTQLLHLSCTSLHC